MNATETKHFVLRTVDGEYLAECNVPKLTLNLREARVFNPETSRGEMVLSYTAALNGSRLFHGAAVELDADGRAVEVEEI